MTTLARSFVRGLGVAVVVLGLVLVAAMGTAGADGSSDLQRVLKSEDALQRAGSSRFRIAISIDKGFEHAGFAMDGSVDFASQNGKFAMDLSALGISDAPGKVKALFVDNVAYVQLAPLLKAMGGSVPPSIAAKKWMRVDTPAGGSGAVDQSDPTASVDALRGMKKGMYIVGTERLRGVRTIHYRGIIDIATAIARTPKREQAEARKSLAVFGHGAVPTDVWLDQQGRLRKMVLRITTSASSEIPNAKLTVTGEFYDLGTPVTVIAPPSNEVIDANQLG